MSEPFFVQGSIEPGTAFHIVSKFSTSQTGGVLKIGTSQQTYDYWSFLGVKEKYVNFDDVYKTAFYYYDSANKNYYYPLFLGSNNGNTIATNVTGLTVYYNATKTHYGTGTDGAGTDGNTAKTTFPSPDTPMVSYEALINNRYYIFGKSNIDPTVAKYYSPIYLTKNNSESAAITISFDEYEDIEFYTTTSPSTDNPNTVTVAGPQNVQTVFYNPFDSLMDSTFKYEQNNDGHLDIQLVSSGSTTPSADTYMYLTYDSGTTPTIGFSNRPQDQKEVTLNTSYNLNKSKIYAGVPYTLGIIGKSSVNYNFVNNITAPPATTQLDKYVGIGNYKTNPSTTSFIGTADTIDYQNTYLVSQITSSEENRPLELYFIPAKQSMHNLSTGEHLTYMEYNVADMVAMSPSVFNVQPLIKSGPNKSTTNNPKYYIWATTGKLITSDFDLAFSSQVHSGDSKIKYSYCSGSDTCGNCFGLCDKNKVLNPTNQCIFDTLSPENHTNPNEETFTCDHERYLEKSKYVSNSFIKNHSNAGLVIILVLGIIIAAGLILYEERNRISKEFFHLKNKK